MRYVSKTILKQVYKKRQPWVHKGQYGKLAVISGSEKHTGSPIFVGMAANRAGCDLVYLIGPERAMNVAAKYSPSLITQPLDGKELEMKHVQTILSFIKTVRATAVVIGPGLWRTEETKKAINSLIEKINLPMVIDADAIRSASSIKGVLKNRKVLLTPHSDEFFELTGVKLGENIKERINSVRKEAFKINCGKDNTCPLYPPVTILLKGNVDVISNGKEIILNDTGTPFMTKGGCGDTLTGISGALFARNIDSFTAACAGAYINGAAGEIASKLKGEGLLPTDLIEEIPNVIK